MTYFLLRFQPQTSINSGEWSAVNVDQYDLAAVGLGEALCDLVVSHQVSEPRARSKDVPLVDGVPERYQLG